MMSSKKKFALVHTLAISVSLSGMAAQAQAAAEVPAPSAAASDSAAQRQAAVDLAKLELGKQKDIDRSTFQIVSVENYTWPDSSLGCGRKNHMAAQVISPGYIISIHSSKGMHVVHATSKYAVVCDRNAILRNPHAVNAPLRNLDDMIANAHNDLATRLHVKPELIRTVTFIATEWPDTSMGCVVDGETVEQKSVKGYRIALNYQGRTFVYHTDMNRVRACPPIELN